MTSRAAIFLLFAAAVLEAGGDALVRIGMRSAAPASRIVWMLAGALALFSYGYTVNKPDWDFGRLLGIYVVFFFVIAQFLSWIVFRHKPDPAMVIGGAFIVAGGVIISVFQRA
jgi:drug/metabolite transporter superfamily protein YnfA